MCGAKGYGFFQPFWSEIEYQFWPFGLNRSLECFLHWSDLGYWFKGQVWNRVGKITYFGLKYGKGFRKRAAHLHPVFWKYPTGPEIGNPLSGIQIPKCLRFPHMRSSWGVGGEGGEGGGGGLRMSLVWISKPVVEEDAMSLSVFSYCICVSFSIAVAVSGHLCTCVVCRHICCPVSLFQGHVVCRNFTQTGPLTCSLLRSCF